VAGSEQLFGVIPSSYKPSIVRDVERNLSTRFYLSRFCPSQTSSFGPMQVRTIAAAEPITPSAYRLQDMMVGNVFGMAQLNSGRQ
jgi:hypothetical protein